MITLSEIIQKANTYIKGKGINDHEVISGLYSRIYLNQGNVTKYNVYACIKQWIQHAEIDVYRQKNRVTQPDIYYSEDQYIYNGEQQSEISAIEKENDFEATVDNIKSMLSPKQAIVFEEFYINEKSIKEISLELNWSESAVKSSIHDARTKIRKFYSQK
jgi:RNA polymerase sigma factor (sigma-70 family)